MGCNNAKNALYNELARLAIIDRDLFMESISKFEVTELRFNDKRVGFFMVNGNEIHIQIPKGNLVKYGIWFLRRVIIPMLAKHGELITFSPNDNEPFLTRLGFVKSDMVGSMYKYILTEIKLKGKSCQC